MRKHENSQSGFGHYLVISLVAVVLIGAAGYFAYQHRLLNVSLTGTLEKSSCTNCSNYSLNSGNKVYALNKLSSLPSSVTPGGTVSVTGTTTPGANTQVTVSTITPINPSPTPRVTPTPTPVSPSPVPSTFPSDIRFSIKTSNDTCSTYDNPHMGRPIGDTGCSITTANGWTIQVERGNINSSVTPGSLTGAPAVTSTWKNLTVNVYAQATSAGQASILTASKYYVQFESTSAKQ